MTRQEFEQQYLVVNEMKFTPRFELQEIEIVSEDGEIKTDFDYIITSTAEEVYQEWMENKDKEPIIEIPLQERNRADIEYLSIMTGVDL